MILYLQDSWTTSLNYGTAATTIPIRVDLTTPQAVCTLHATICTLKDFKNAKNENYCFLHPEHFFLSLTDKNEW